MEPTVVCAFDPEAGDRAPVELAGLAARVLRARLVVAIVRPGGSAPERLARLEQRGGPWSLGTLEASLRREHAVLREVAAPSPAAGLHHVLAVERPALAVVGSAQHAPHGRVRLGTTTERLLDGTPCPVAIAPRGWAERPLEAIAVAVLPSPEGRAALRAAAAVARAAGVPLRVLMVLSDSPDEHEASELARELSPDRDLTVARADGVAVAAGSLPPADPPPAAILRPTGRSRGGAVLQPALTSAAHGLEPAARLDVASDVFVGDPADTLIRASKRAGLLVLGSRAYGSASEVHAGGVARRVLAAARCPVVLVPRETARG